MTISSSIGLVRRGGASQQERDVNQAQAQAQARLLQPMRDTLVGSTSIYATALRDQSNIVYACPPPEMHGAAVSVFGNESGKIAEFKRMV
jgi:hypothetical protein